MLVDNMAITEKNKEGYLVFLDSGKSVHRWKAEKKYGKEAIIGKEVHHINKDKMDNADTNLLLVSKADHYNIHQYENKIEFLTYMIITFTILAYITFSIGKIFPAFHLIGLFSLIIIGVLASEIKLGIITKAIKRPNDKAFEDKVNEKTN